MPAHKVAKGVLSDFYVVAQQVDDYQTCYDSNPDCPLSPVSHGVRLFGKR